ncbi:hypothetical protein PV08_05467 [Exophiala spinifera]|uniref:Kinetochore protein Sos7 coiled-coil domain-containing protein n=1 Tax=Exophiala spinifera TaxID=91928 RepID=A0A0D1YKB8_9EURO|nr:uncharacterized protein PV08_05467 [Exophiala spinifera]KIW15421.1 hypothetical protein PV08_05467 [Exophiala spinifera]
MSSSLDYASTLSAVRAQQAENPLSILALAEPMTASQTEFFSSGRSATRQRQSDVSSTNNASTDTGMADSLQLTPASLAADLAHYKDLFSKLRFSYLEQVTKEKYLRSIVGDPPSVVGHEENAVLEVRLGAMKAELQDKKRGVDALVENMEAQARTLAAVYEDVNAKIAVLERANPNVDRLRAEVEALRRELVQRQEGGEDGDTINNSRNNSANARKRRERDDPRMNLSLDETARALEEQNARMAGVEERIDALERDIPSKVARLEEVDRELAELDRRRNESVRLAVEGKRRKEAGGRDEVEELGKWYRCQEVVMKGLGLDVNE